MKLSKFFIVLIALISMQLQVNAQTNSTCVVVQPNQAYVNTSNNAQVILVNPPQNNVIQQTYVNPQQQPQQSTIVKSYQALNSGIGMVTNIMYSVRTLLSQFGGSY